MIETENVKPVKPGLTIVIEDQSWNDYGAGLYPPKQTSLPVKDITPGRAGGNGNPGGTATSYPSVEKQKIEVNFVHKVMRDTIDQKCLAKEVAEKQYYTFFKVYPVDVDAWEKFNNLRKKCIKRGTIDTKLNEEYMNRNK